MRYKTLQLITIVLAITLLYAAATNKLTLYIHPRYTTFTIVLVSIGLVLLCITSLIHNPHNTKQLTLFQSIPLYIIVICALILAPSALSQTLASSRSSISQQNNLSNVTHSTLDTFSTDLTRFSIADWNNLLASQPTEAQINDKKAILEGFLYKDDSDQLFIARFRLTCCAVDATPLAVPIVSSSEIDAIELGTWVAISGKFVKSSDDLHPWQLEIETAKTIEAPDEPYIY